MEATQPKKTLSGDNEVEVDVGAVIDSALDGIISIDQYGTIRSFNPAAQRLFGYLSGEAIGNNVTMLMPEPYRYEHDRYIASYLRTGDAKIIGTVREVIGRRKDGFTFPLDLSISEMQVGGEQMFVGILRDISKRKRAEGEINKRQQRLDVVNALLEILLQDISFEQQLELALDEILSIPWLPVKQMGGIFLIEDDPEVLVLKAHRGMQPEVRKLCTRVPFGKCICGKAAATRKVLFVDRIDHNHEIRSNMFPHGHYSVPIIMGERVLGVVTLYVEEGHPYDEQEVEFLQAVVNTLAGIIERKRAEEMLRQQALIIDQIHDSVMSMDLDGQVTSWNKGAERLFGYAATEMVGSHISYVYPEDEHKFLQQQIIAPLKLKGEHEMEEVRMCRKSDEDFYAHLSLSMLRNDRGTATGMICYAIDITEHRQAENQTRELLRKNRSLTKCLINLQEKEYRRLARELHDELGQSLAAIKTDAVLISNRSQGHSVVIHQSAQAIMSVVSHIYDVTHSMMRRLRPSALDDLGLSAALETFVNHWRLRHPWLPCTLTLSDDLDDLGEEINITIYRFVQESMTNVVRHAAASRVSICLMRDRKDGDADHVQVRVKDDGRGMIVRKAVESGRTFGLLGIRERVEGLGGELSLDSNIGKGLCLTADIPIVKDG